MKCPFANLQKKKHFLQNHYNNYNEEARLSDKCGQIEFLTTMRYIEKFLHKDMKVLEIGAGTGRYSRAIAGKGNYVDAVELCDKNVKTFKSLIKTGDKLTVTQGNALNLDFIKDEQYDMVLVLGPMYHLYNEEDKKRCMEEALRVTKPKGILFFAYILSDSVILYSGFEKHVFNVASYIEKGKINPETWDTKSEPTDIFELTRKENIDALIKDYPLKRLYFVATDLLAETKRKVINKMSDKEYGLFLKYHFSICERSDIVGISSHVIDVLQKNKEM